MDASDAQLLRAAARDPEAFGVFYDRYAAALLAWFMRRTGDPVLAADLTSETFAKAFASRRSYRDTGAPAVAWLFGIARHELGRFARRRRVDDRARRRLGIAKSEYDDASLERIEELADLDVARAAISAAMAALPPETAQALTLRIVEELSYDEVAEQLGCSTGAARVRVTRGLRRLARSLEEQ
ncbi:RNA polymerase sigma factor [Solirubrobacter sp. CPCC 204708]|uniref:RNA polymerase sigma factor n=1 Tax=Solirubrobacter deserti TaxID=2282478 RepID=A0ABT4RP35_9ACTN|nr:RNA polymerase sigma factor [Solirubrobacter deserti]MBE2317505.1 RNA polymerase sigma factor [Solirubrobacter deserti]MDA0140319.1 RNA polymerase sigma factor [Solirubrobacter deserti]